MMPIDINTIDTMHSTSSAKIEVLAVNPMREQVLREIASGVGARGGLAWRYDQINNMLIGSKDKLDSSWNFKGLLISRPNAGTQSTAYSILPPVLLEANTIYSQEGGDKVTLADVTYKIESQARFVSAPPTWREYILHNFPAAERPHDSLLPKNADEQKIWVEASRAGWASGIQQAESVFTADLNRLKRDYEGMVRYLNLRNRGIVSAPFVAEAVNGVTGNASEMNVGERILRITSMPTLNHNSREWKPIATEGAQ